MSELLTHGNPKTVKGEKQGYLTFILHLAPAKVSGFEVCPDRSPACTFLCLNTAGRGGIFKHGEKTNAIQKARKRKTLQFVHTRDQFMQDLVASIRKAIAYANKRGLIPVFRLNGTSDIAWETIPVGGARNVFALFPDVQFYDYTKTFLRIVRTEPNYHLTFSYSEKNYEKCVMALAMGRNVAVVFDHKKPMPELFLGTKVINADESDLRFRDPKGVVCGLKAKGKARKDTSGFVVRFANSK